MLEYQIAILLPNANCGVKIAMLSVSVRLSVCLVNFLISSLPLVASRTGPTRYI